MERISTPAFEPALCLLTGAAYADAVWRTGWSLPLATLLVALAWAHGGRWAKLTGWFAIGLLLVWSGGESRGNCLERLETGRPVTLVGRLITDWQATDFGWRSELAVTRARQGAAVVRCRTDVTIRVGGQLPQARVGRVRVKGYLKRYLPLRNGTVRHPQPSSPRARFAMQLKSPRFVRADSQRPPGADLFRGAGRRLRSWVAESFDGVEERPGAQAARALLLGERQALGPSFERSLRRFGLSHLFAVSGLHVALLGLVVHWLLRGMRPRPRLLLTTGAVLLYLVLIGARPSIVRATAMSILAIGALWSRRPPHSRQALCLAAGALVLLDPPLIANLAFRLTVSATAGILWLAPLLEDRWAFLWRPLRRSLAATVSAQLASLPWTVTAFSVLHPLAPVTNLLAIPWMAAFAVLSMLGSSAMRASSRLKPTVAAILDTAIAPWTWLESLPPSPWILFPVANSFVEACLLVACLAVALLARSKSICTLALLAALPLLRGPSLPEFAEMIAIDVGQGDAILLHDARQAVLVDGGGWKTSDIASGVLVPALARLGIRRLSAAIVTHPDVDHCRGLLDLSYLLPIDRVLIPPGVSLSPCLRELVARPGIRWRVLWRGQALRVGRINLETLHPSAGSPDLGNDSSLVLRASLGNRSILLSGDLESAGERVVSKRVGAGALRSQILKLGHHGSKTSTSEGFLRSVAPAVAIVSSGRGNHYGHPASEVLRRCLEHGVRVLRTDRDGMIRIALEPHQFSSADRSAGERRSPWLRLWSNARVDRDRGTDGHR